MSDRPLSLSSADRDSPSASPVTELAQAEVREVRDELLRLSESAAAKDPRFPGEVAAAWLLEYRSSNTRAAYAGDLARFFVWCSRQRVHVFEVRRDHLAAYLADPAPGGQRYAPKTVERRLAAISGFYSYALELDLVEKHPRGHAKPLTVEARRAQGAPSLSKAEFETFVRAAAEHSDVALAVVYLLGLYGLRVTEVCELDIDAIDWDQGQPVLRVAGKGRAANETTMFPLPHDVLQVLQSAAGDRTDGVLLLKRTGRSYVRQEISALLRTLCRAAGIETKLTPHGLRATFITLALNEGAALRDVQDAARHADPRTTRLYDRDAGALNRHPVHRLLGVTHPSEPSSAPLDA